MGDAGLVPFGRTATTHALMGRFGNVFLVNGDVRPGFAARRGDVVRFAFINAANARTFNLSFPARDETDRKRRRTFRAQERSRVS